MCLLLMFANVPWLVLCAHNSKQTNGAGELINLSCSLHLAEASLYNEASLIHINTNAILQYVLSLSLLYKLHLTINTLHFNTTTLFIYSVSHQVVQF